MFKQKCSFVVLFVLFFSTIFLSSNVSASTYTASLSTSGTVNLNVSASGNGANVTSDSLSIISTCPSGYNVSIEGPTDSTLYKNGNSSNNSATQKILASSGTRNNPVSILGNNVKTWGYTTESINGSSPITTSSNFVGLTDTITNIFSSNTATSSSGTTLPVYYGASVDSTIEPGLYTMAESSQGANDNKITYYLTTALSCTSYTVNFSPTSTAGGQTISGTGTMNPQTISEGTATTLTANAYTAPSGYYFAGWNTQQDGTGTHYSDQQQVTDLTTVGNSITLYAEWALNTSTLTINFAGSGVSSVKVCKTSGDCSGANLMGTVSTNGGSVSGLVHSTSYYLYPAFSTNYELDSWAKTGGAGTLSSTSALNPTFTMGTANGEVTITGKSSKIYMQDMTESQCSSLASSADYTVYDRRDESAYTVRYLNNKCWMTQNLRITGTLSASESNFTGNNFNVSTGNLTSGDSYTEARSTYSNDTTNGAYYNYCAASAGTVCNDTEQKTATEDICPAGWRLPVTSEITSISSSQGANWNVVSAGKYSGGSLSYSGTYGYWWGSTSSSVTSQMTLNKAFLWSSGAATKTTGNSIRCVKYTPNTVTVNFSSDITSVTINGTTIDTSGSSITLSENTSYTITGVANNNDYEVGTITVTSGNATASGNSFNTETGNSTINVTATPKPVVTFTFGSDITSITVNGTTINTSGGTVTLPSNTSYRVTGVASNSDYEVGNMTVVSGNATVDGNYINTQTGNSTINVVARQKPAYTFTFDSGISSIEVDGKTVNASGGSVILSANTQYKVSVISNSGYMVNTMTVTSGNARVNDDKITTGTTNATFNISSQAAQNVTVTFSGEYIDHISIDNTQLSSLTATLVGGQTYSVEIEGAYIENQYLITGASTTTPWYVIESFGEANNVTFSLTVGITDATINVSTRYPGCITADTLVTLANGTKVPVKELKGDEELLVWDFETGSYSTAPIVFIDPEKEDDYDIIHLYFSDNTDIEVFYEHGFYDHTLNKYIYINDDNPEQYIGHQFVKQDGNTYKTVELTRIEHETKHTAVYGLTTFKHFNFFNNDMLSIEGNITGMFNYFEVDQNTLSYDQAQKQADIEQYGLLTYEELKEHIGDLISELGFEAYNGQYLKVSIGKGLITWDGIKALAERYGHFTDENNP